jgi:16S rRNA (uracil1498-N3)-methyltransferase
MHLFYTPDVSGSFYTLDEQESKHCIKVLRLQLNDTVQLVDGKGGFYTAIIREAHPKKCRVEITGLQQEDHPRDYHLHIAIAPTKNNDRLEWFLEKATEIGIDEITPLLCEHSERKVIKPDRLEKVLTAAMKQSLKATRPRLNGIIPYADFIRKPFPGVKYIAHCDEQQKKMLAREYPVGRDVLILIGPEGDFSKAEVELALQHEFTGVSLGQSRLRTETAGVVACHTIHLLNALHPSHS